MKNGKSFYLLFKAHTFEHVLQKTLFLFNMKLIFLYSEHYFRKKSFGINNVRTVFLQQEE